MKLNIGILFGGSSRQREQSFLNARSLFTNLDRQLFEPVPIFADSQQRLYLPDWQLLFRKSLADFFPGQENAAFSEAPFPVYGESLGESTKNGDPPAFGDNVIPPASLPQRINFAIVALCGTPEEDAWAYALLESAHIPYAGHSPIARRHLASFAATRNFLAEKGFHVPVSGIMRRTEWKREYAGAIYQNAVQKIGLPFKIFSTADPALCAKVDQGTDLDGFCTAVETSFYEETLPFSQWQEMSLYERTDHLRQLADLRIGLGFPVYVTPPKSPGTLIYHPEGLLHFLNACISNPTLEENSTCHLSSALPAGDVVLEALPAGKPFSATVLTTDQGPLAFAPIGRGGHNAFYNNGSGEWSENIFSPEESEAIRKTAGQIADVTGLRQVFTVSGRIAQDRVIYVEYVSTGMHFFPGEPLFLAAAQAGLIPCEWLTALLYLHLRTQLSENPSEISWRGLLEYFLEILAAKNPPQTIGILCTGTPDKQVLQESTGQIVQFLGAEGSFRPVPFFVEQIQTAFYLRQQPPVQLLREEGATASIPFLQKLFPAVPVFPTGRFPIGQLATMVSAAFLDIRSETVQGQLQRALKTSGIAFNGPGAAAAGVAVHPFQCMEALRRNTDLAVCGQILLAQPTFQANANASIQRIESRFPYPFTGIVPGWGALPIYRREELEAFIRLFFRPEGTEGTEVRKILRIKPQQIVPIQKEILFQELTRPHGASHLLTLSVPLIGKVDQEGSPVYQCPGPQERSNERLLPLQQVQERLCFDQLDFSLQNAIASVSNKAAENAVRVLNLQGAVCVDLTVRIYANGHIEPVIEHLEVFPEWKLSGQMVRAIIQQGEFPGNTLAGILHDSIAKPRLEQLALAAQTEHISAPAPYAGALNSDQGEPLNGQAHNTAPSMENTPPPSPRNHAREIHERLPASGILGIIQGWILDFWYFIRSAIFLKNLGAAIVFIFLLFNLISVGLKLYTNHGQAVEVQDYQGMTAREARRKARSRSFTTIVNDSIYIVGKAPNIVLDQIPKPGSRIKKNRLIYLTVSSSTPPNIPLPSLVGGNDDFEQYRKKLERMGIKARIKDREFNAELEDNTILYLVYKGKRIEPGDLKRGVKVPKGSTLEVVVSIRNTGTVDIPDLVCRTYEEAIFLLQSSQLTVGSIFAPGEPLPWHYVYKQEPVFNPTIKLSVGEGINLYLQEEKPDNCKEY